MTSGTSLEVELMAVQILGFFSALGFELKASHFLSMFYSTSSFFMMCFFQDKVSQTISPGLDSNYKPPDHCLLSS
jgi:hypothetical protein